MKKAGANLEQSKSALFPSLSLNASAVNQWNNSNNPELYRNYQVYGNTSWEADIWGKLRSTKRANLAAYLQSEAYKRAVQTQLIANVSVSYYSLLALDAQLKITEKTIEKRKANVESMKMMKDNDMVTGADLVMSEANRYSAEVTIPDLKQNIYKTENALSILLGRNPGPIPRGVITSQEVSHEIETGVPFQLLANRPDVQEAELKYRYNYEMTKVARSYFYPTLTLSASGGISANNFSFDPSSLFWNFIGGLAQPIFNNGAIKQRYRVADSNREESLLAFKQTLLTAGAEVVNAMKEYQSASEKISIRTNQIKYLEKSVDFTMELLKYTSSTNYTDVLTSEVNLLNAQLNSVNDKLQQLHAIVTLYQSLGGGWKE
jgi:NodT family efflux transporter outer membrane factor (OMF) lipoprotein